MKVFDKFLDIMGFSDGSEEESLPEENIQPDETTEWKHRKNKGHLVPFNVRDSKDNKEQVKVILLEPISFDDSQQIADNLKIRRTVIINLENMDMILARRIIDFVGGTTYALGGTLQKIGAGIIIAVPSNVDITGDINNLDQPKEVFAWINKVIQNSETRRY